MSRVGRDYLQTGFYTEIFFREHGVHFIAIANNVDNEDQSSNEFAPFLNIMNEWYLRDQSRKIKASFKMKGNSGKPLSHHCIYGYKKDPEDKNLWLIDEEAAEVVRRIFRLSIEGHGPCVIAEMLRDDKVESPGYYLAIRGRGSWQNSLDMSRPYDWYGSTVSSILAKPEYMGHTVNFRTSKKSYKDKREQKNDPSEWVIFENTHEAIVDPETWALAQHTKRAIHRTDTTGVANPLTGLMFCADCGGRMYEHRRNTPFKDGSSRVCGSYECAHYNSTRQRHNHECSSHSISTNAVMTLLLDTIRTVSEYAIQNREEFERKVREAAELRQASAAKELRKKISKAKKRSAELDVLIKGLYESFLLGKIPEKRFQMLTESYELEQAELEEIISTDESALEVYMADNERIEQFLTLAKKYTDFSELTPTMINEFVEKIIVHEPVRIDGERCQEVEIYLRFIGNFQVPAKEPTPEELEQMERDRKRRAKAREYYQRRKAKIAEKENQASA